MIAPGRDDVRLSARPASSLPRISTPPWPLAQIAQRSRRDVRQGASVRRRRRRAAGHLGHESRPGRRGDRQRARSGPSWPSDADRKRLASRAGLHGPAARHADRRRSRSTACSSARVPTGGSKTCGPPRPWSAGITSAKACKHGRARQRTGQAPGRGRGTGPDLHGRGLRVARGRLQHVPGHEPRQAGAGRALRVDQQPQFRGPAGQRAAARIWSRPPWPPRPPWPAISSTFANGNTSNSEQAQ